MTASENPGVLRLDAQGVQIWRAGQKPVSIDEVAEGLRANCIFAVPADRARLTQIEVRSDEHRHLKKSLPFMLEDEVIDPVESMHFSYAPIDDSHYLVALASHAEMTFWLEQLGDQFEGPFFHEALLLPWQPGEVCAVVEAHSVLLRWGEHQGARVESDLLAPLMDALPAPPEAVIVYGGDQERDLALLPNLLQERAQWRQGDFGTALMLVDSAQGFIDMRQGVFAPSLPLRRWWQKWKPLTIALLVAVVLQVASDMAQYWRLKESNIALRTAIEASYRKANPQGALVDAEKQLDRQIAEYAVGAKGLMFTRVLDRIGRAISVGGELTLSNINYSDNTGEVRLDLLAPTYDEIEALRERFAAGGMEAILETSSQRGVQVRARLRVTL
ncbi:type II secretion system protein GspL [Luminiphilus sp. nBUS_07]|uniref:type II secretion system protein GspL n=1 Tax=Luminiphilus sp. nBUS_07 TaxID=3395314 RepID=UPI003EBC93E7